MPRFFESNFKGSFARPWHLPQRRFTSPTELSTMLDAPLNVLIADADDETRRRLREVVLSFEPEAAIHEAGDGAELGAMLADGRVDLLVIDVLLPRTDGAQITAWRARKGKRCAIVLVTDILSPRWPVIASTVGAYEVLLKPVRPDKLGQLVDAARFIRRELKVLLVEPLSSTRGLIHRLIGQSCFTCAITESDGGRQAVRQAAFGSFDLALVEVGLPDLPGTEVACRLQERSPATRVVMMGANVEPAVQRTLSTFGVAGYLPKPFYFPDFDKAIHEALGLWRPYLINAIIAERGQQLARSA